VQPAANSDTIDHQSLEVALHARYLLALKGHRRGAFMLGFVYGVCASAIVVAIYLKVFPLLFS